MLLDRPTDDALYDALISRDPSYEGLAFVGVTSTGIFCRLTCAARKPKRENTVFFQTIAECLEAGFRPCKRCTPVKAAARAEPVVEALLAAIEAEPGRRWREGDVAAMGYDPSTVRRAFRRRYGMTFLEMARLARLGRAADELAAGGDVLDAQLEAGFESASGFRDAFAALVGDAPTTARSRASLKAAPIDTPLGLMVAVADENALHVLEFLDRRALKTELHKVQKTLQSTVGFGVTGPTRSIEHELNAYFDGSSATFATPLAFHGSAFTQSVWRALIDIPAGETRSYAELAAALDAPTATRAVARANGANQIAIAVPCHRVIGADGSLTGYGGGLWRKRWLIEHEARHFSNGRNLT